MNDKKPSEVSYGSNNKYWFKCNKGIHESELWNMDSITSKSAVCNISCRKCKSFGQYLLDNYGNLNVWSSNNNVDPFEIWRASRNKVYIRCENELHPDYNISPNTFTRGVRCAVCKNKKTYAGINDIATTHPNLLEYFANAEDAKKYTYSSRKKVVFRCKNCGSEKAMSIHKFSSRGLSCSSCSDGISYSEKYIYNLLKSIDVDFVPQLSKKNFEWCGNYRYDFYIKEYDLIIEVNGMQHYKQSGYGKSLGDEIENDIVKLSIAKENGVKNYITLDCRNSELEWIKNSVINSGLISIINVNEGDIDWINIDIKSQKSRLVEVCNYYNENNGVKKDEISKIFNIGVSTAHRYLARGTKLGICKYKAENKRK